MINLELWKPNPEHPGYLMLDRYATKGEVFDQAVAALKAAGLWDALDYFHLTRDWDAGSDARQQPWPAARWVGCFAVEGDNEGWYIHVEAVGLLDENRLTTDRRELVLMGKTFDGLTVAMMIANALTREFYHINAKAPPERELVDTALDQLLIAYAKGERAGHVEWEDIGHAFECAKAARPGRYEVLLQELAQDDEEAEP